MDGACPRLGIDHGNESSSDVDSALHRRNELVMYM